MKYTIYIKIYNIYIKYACTKYIKVCIESLWKYFYFDLMYINIIKCSFNMCEINYEPGWDPQWGIFFICYLEDLLLDNRTMRVHLVRIMCSHPCLIYMTLYYCPMRSLGSVWPKLRGPSACIWANTLVQMLWV